MMSTLTSTIASTTGSVLQNAEIQNNRLPQALFTVTFLVGAIMFVLGMLRLTRLVQRGEANEPHSADRGQTD